MKSVHDAIMNNIPDTMYFISTNTFPPTNIFENPMPKSFNGTTKIIKIITDNINFHGLVNSNQPLKKNLRQLVKKIENYIEFLKNNNHYQTKFYDIGDGISISVKR